MEWSPVSETEVTMALRTTLNWKAPGRDQIQNFCLKQLTATHKYLTTLFNRLIEEDQTTECLKAGATLLIQKSRTLKSQRTADP
jgi:hypothetical protein